MPRLVLDVLFPGRCAGCGAAAWPFCGACRGTLVPFGPPWCQRCGLPGERDVASCRECLPVDLVRTRSAFLFAGAARTAVHRLKFSGWRPVAAALGGAMAATFDAERDADVACVTWVPLSAARRAQRGFDQAELLARAVATRIGVPAHALLERTVTSTPQARRVGEERRTALRHAFAAVRPPPACSLLVDDVVTTGSTAAACASTLRRAGAERVVLLTAARSVSAPMPRRYTRAGLAPGSVVARGTSPR